MQYVGGDLGHAGLARRGDELAMGFFQFLRVSRRSVTSSNMPECR